MVLSCRKKGLLLFTVVTTSNEVGAVVVDARRRFLSPVACFSLLFHVVEVAFRFLLPPITFLR